MLELHPKKGDDNKTTYNPIFDIAVKVWAADGKDALAGLKVGPVALQGVGFRFTNQPLVPVEDNPAIE